MLIVKPATEEEIKAVLFDDWIWERSTDDSCCSREQVRGFPSGIAYLGGYVGGKIIGLAIAHLTTIGLEFHFAVLKPYRKMAREFLCQVLKFIPRPLYCDIPDCYREVINFAKHAGFQEQGKFGEHVKHGKTYQVTRLWAQ